MVGFGPRQVSGSESEVSGTLRGALDLAPEKPARGEEQGISVLENFCQVDHGRHWGTCWGHPVN